MSIGAFSKSSNLNVVLMIIGSLGYVEDVPVLSLALSLPESGVVIPKMVAPLIWGFPFATLLLFECSLMHFPYYRFIRGSLDIVGFNLSIESWRSRNLTRSHAGHQLDHWTSDGHDVNGVFSIPSFYNQSSSPQCPLQFGAAIILKSLPSMSPL